MSETEIGASGMTDESLPYPWRKVTYTFSKQEDGDDRFLPKVQRAMIELMAADTQGEIEDFTASNGVRVRVSYPTTDYSTMPEPEPMKDYVVDEVDGEGNLVASRTMGFLTAPIGHALKLRAIGDNHDEVQS